MICPYCHKPFPAPTPDSPTHKYRPFCSERCKLADLGAWASGKYTIPVVDLDDMEDITSEESAANEDDEE